MKEFKVNEFLTMKLEEGKTNIYVNGELFDQCKYLMLNITVEDISKYDEIDSIDEAAEILGWTYDGQVGVEYRIDPETEFWGHCSNLQAWYEYDYDTRLVHSSLSFPLLKKLVIVGDPIAKKVFKEEIVKRFESGNLSTVIFIFEERLLSFLSKEEQKSLFEQTLPHLKNPENITIDIRNIKSMIDACNKVGVLEESFSFLMNVIYNFPVQDRYFAFKELFYLLKNDELLNTNSSQIKIQLEFLLNNIDDVPDENKHEALYDLIQAAEISELLKEIIPVFSVDKLPKRKYQILSELIKAAEMTGLLEDIVPILWNSLPKLSGQDRYFTFLNLVIIIKNENLLNNYFDQIKTQLEILLNGIANLGDCKEFFSDLFGVAVWTGLLEDNIISEAFFNANLKIKFFKRDVYSNIIEAVKGTLGNDKKGEVEFYLYRKLLIEINRILYQFENDYHWWNWDELDAMEKDFEKDPDKVKMILEVCLGDIYTDDYWCDEDHNSNYYYALKYVAKYNGGKNFLRVLDRMFIPKRKNQERRTKGNFNSFFHPYSDGGEPILPLVHLLDILAEGLRSKDQDYRLLTEKFLNRIFDLLQDVAYVDYDPYADDYTKSILILFVELYEIYPDTNRIDQAVLVLPDKHRKYFYDLKKILGNLK